MAFNLGAFAGGIGQGIEQGQNIRDKYREAAAKALARKADQNYSAMLEQAASGKVNPVPAPGGPPQGGAPPAPGPAGGGAPGMAPPPAMGGGAPPPGMGGQPAPQVPRPVPMPGAQPMPQAGGPPMGGAPPPGGAPPQMQRPPMPPPQGGPPGQPPQGGGAPPGGGGPQGDIAKDPMAQSKLAIQSMAREIAQAFPGKKWQPGELLATVDSALEHMQAVDPTVKQLAQLQIQWYKAQLTGQGIEEKTRHDQAQEGLSQGRLDESTRSHDLQHGDRMSAIKASLDRASMAQSGADRRAQLNATTREFVANLQQAGANDRAQMVDDYKREALDAGLTEKEWKASMDDETRNRGIDVGAQSRDYAANPIGKPPVTVPRPMRQPLPGRGGGRGAPAGGAGPPPQALQHLKEGQNTTFANGQTWTLKGGKPVRVK